jgi:threonine aldolase
MLRAMVTAPVGDDVFGEDPTVNLLEERTAALLGKEAGVFVPTGTMANGVALRSLASPGDEVLCGARSHVFNFEGAQFALNGGIQMHPLPETPGGTPDPSTVAALFSRKTDIHNAPRTVAALENTHNMLGGVVCSRGDTAEIVRLAGEAGAGTFLDGARLWHAAPPSELASLAEGFTMLSVCFSKALGCPVGSLVAGPRDLVDRARWYRKRMGGGMRQAGVLAGACVWALDHHLPRIPETHRMCRILAEAAAGSPGLACDPSRHPTNILMAEVPGGNAFQAAARLAALGVGVLPVGPSTVRLVTHLSLAEEDVLFAAGVLSGFGG